MTAPTGDAAPHRMLPGSHERPGGPECTCGAAWDRWEDRCAAPTADRPGIDSAIDAAARAMSEWQGYDYDRAAGDIQAMWRERAEVCVRAWQEDQRRIAEESVPAAAPVSVPNRPVTQPAPEALTALRDLVEFYDMPIKREDRRDLWNAARAALASAPVPADTPTDEAIERAARAALEAFHRPRHPMYTFDTTTEGYRQAWRDVARAVAAALAEGEA